MINDGYLLYPLEDQEGTSLHYGGIARYDDRRRPHKGSHLQVIQLVCSVFNILEAPIFLKTRVSLRSSSAKEP